MTASREIAIDIGGTWFRVMDGDQTHAIPSPSRLNHPLTPAADLYRQLIGLILDFAPQAGSVAISLGAATDDVTMQVVGSGPLWGDWRPPHSLYETLIRARPDLSWAIFNDVSCALAHFSTTVDPAQASHIGFLTVSSGIALRIADLDRGSITVDAAGMQGEVGHLPLPTGLRDDVSYGLDCECGGRNHVASASSGPGIRRVSLRLGITEFTTDWFSHALDQGDARAHRLLDITTEPIACLLRTIWTTQPWIGALAVGGGVPESIHSHYDAALRTHLSTTTGYTTLPPETWDPGLRVLSRHDHISNMRGAQLLARQHLTIRKARARPHAT